MEENDNPDSPLLGIRKEDEEKNIDAEIKKSLREGFIAKVFGIFTYQMVILFLVVFLGFASTTFKQMLLKSTLMYVLTFIIFMACLIAPIYNPNLYRKVPINYIITTIFSFSYSWWIAEYTVRFTATSVLVALGLTVALCTLITLYALWTKKDYTVMGGFLFSSLILLILCSLICIFIRIPILHVILIYIGLILFGLYLSYDVQLIVGRGEEKFAEDDYILASINIYLDVIGIFIRILALFGSRN